jgi:hypothetical protein
MARDKLMNLIFVSNRWLEQVLVRAAMAREEDRGEHKDGTTAEVEGVERLEEKWWWRKG